MKEVVIAPSDFAFLYDESPWAFHQKYISGIRRPPLILPKSSILLTLPSKSNMRMKIFPKCLKIYHKQS